MPGLQSSSWGSINQQNITVPNLWQLQAAPGALTAVCSGRGEIHVQHQGASTDAFTLGSCWRQMATSPAQLQCSAISELEKEKALFFFFFLPPHKALIALMRKTEPECTFSESTFDYLLEKMSLSLNTRDCFMPELRAQKPTYMILHCSVGNFFD